MTKKAKLSIICGLATTALVAVWNLKSHVFSMRAKPIAIAQAFPHVKIPLEAVSVAYTITGKDRYTWGRLSMRIDKTAAFRFSNGIASGAGERNELEGGMTSMKTLLRFNPELQASWIDLSYLPEEIALTNGTTFLFGRKEGDAKTSIIYLFRVN
jgi:hypothetical protein